ncbi:endoglucanase, partial [Ruminococcus albus]
MAITAGLSAAAASAPMSVFAEDEQILIQSDFEAGIGLPWYALETEPARQDFDISDGTYNVEILNNDGPESRWDLSLRCKDLVIRKGHTYKVHWEVNSSKEGEMYTMIGNNSGVVEVWHNNSGNDNYNQTWECVKIAKGDNTFDAEFTAKEDIDNAIWEFQYGGQGVYQPHDCFPNGTVLKFDNLSLIDTTGGYSIDSDNNDWGVVRPESNVRLNQIGYYPQLEKRASYVTDADKPLDFEIRDRSGNVKYTGKTKVFGSDPDSGTGKTTTVKIGSQIVTRLKDSGSNVHIIDFSDFKTEGTYTIFVKDTVGVNGTQVMNSKNANDTKLSGDKLLWRNPVTMKTYTMNESSTFRIDRNIYDDQLLKDSINYFYQNRSGVPIESEYITSGDKSALAHSRYGHNLDMAYVQSKWYKSYSSDFSEGEKDKQIDVTGGWYAASDHGKYVVEGGFSVWTLQNAYEFSKRRGNTRKWTDGTIAVPENKDNAPDILDEARVELEWMFKMINEDGFVYHSVQDHKWAGFPITPWMDDTQQGFEPVRIVRPPTYAATFNMIACAAQASRLWKGIDDDFSEECLQNAQNSWKAIMAKQSNWDVNRGYHYKDPYFAPSEYGVNNIFGDTYVVDDAYWAACELYATTGDADYYDFLKDYKNCNDPSGQDKAFSLTSCLRGGENDRSFGSFNWGNTAGLGTLSLYLSDKTSSADRKTIANSIQNIADQYLIQMSKEGMGIPYKSMTTEDYIGGDKPEFTGYEYGSNSFVINNAMVLAYAYDTDNGKYIYRNGAA